MITLEELRIGNYISVDSTVRKICSLKNDDNLQGKWIGFENNNDCEYESASSERLDGVKITNELLQKMGFNFDSHFKLWKHTRPDKTYSIELDNDYFPLDFSHHPIVRNLTCIHQLQNLFFSIQGQELEFT